MSEIFDQSPLFQLNLILWLVWSSAAQRVTGIRPFFYDEGFRLHAIGQSFSSTLPVRTRANNLGIAIQEKASPDVLLMHEEHLVLLPIECKKRSFGPEYSQSTSQANALLCQTGNLLASQIGLPTTDWQSHLHYAVSHEDAHLILKTLENLERHLNEAKIDTVHYRAIGVEVLLDDGIYLEFADNPSNNSAPYTPTENLVKVKSLDHGEAPDFLYLVPIDMSAREINPIEARLLEERLRSAFVSIVMHRLINPEFEVDEEEIFREAIEVWDYWKERDAKLGLVRKAMRPYINDILTELKKFQIEIRNQNRHIYFGKVTSDAANKIRTYFTSKKFREGGIHLIDNSTRQQQPLPGSEEW